MVTGERYCALDPLKKVNLKSNSNALMPLLLCNSSKQQNNRRQSNDRHVKSLLDESGSAKHLTEGSPVRSTGTQQQDAVREHILNTFRKNEALSASKAICWHV